MTQEKQDRSRDRLLGMDQPITRRDFLNGIAIGAAVAASGPLAAASADPAAGAGPGAAPLPPFAQDAFGYYPPLLTGLPGNHPAPFEPPHPLPHGHTGPPTCTPPHTTHPPPPLTP